MPKVTFEYEIDEAEGCVFVSFVVGDNKTRGEGIPFGHFNSLAKSDIDQAKLRVNAQGDDLRAVYDMCFLSALDELMEKGLI